MYSSFVETSVDVKHEVSTDSSAAQQTGVLPTLMHLRNALVLPVHLCCLLFAFPLMSPYFHLSFHLSQLMLPDIGVLGMRFPPEGCVFASNNLFNHTIKEIG